MRIVLSCLPSMGGSAITTVALAGALAERGHVVALVAADPPFASGVGRSAAAGSVILDGVAYHWPSREAHPVLGVEALTNVRVAELVGRVARELDADIVNPHYIGSLLPACALGLAAMAPGAVLVASAHGTDVTAPAAGTEALTAAVLRQAAATTTVSAYLADRLVSDFDVPEHLVHVIPNWIGEPPALPASHAEFSRSANDDLLLAHASNFRPVKRAVRCADALAAANRVTPSRLLLIGDGPDRDRVLARAAALGVGDRVTAVGVVTPRTAFALLATADVAVLPSASEACSGVLLQALAAGIPAVAYAVAGNPGVATHMRTGLLVPDERDAAGFAGAAARLAGDVHLRRSLGAGARLAAAGFDRERAVAAYEAVFASAVAGRVPALAHAS